MDWFNRNWRGLSFVGILIAVWAIVAALRLIDPDHPSRAPWNVVRAIPAMLRERLLADIALTLGRVLAALAVACVFGIPVGLFLGYRQRAYKVVEGPLHALRSVPASALFPLFLIVAGVGETSIVALAAYPSLLVIMVNAISGAALANQSRLYQARLLNLNSWHTVSDVLFYEALPSIFDGIRTAVSYALGAGGGSGDVHRLGGTRAGARHLSLPVQLSHPGDLRGDHDCRHDRDPAQLGGDKTSASHAALAAERARGAVRVFNSRAGSFVGAFWRWLDPDFERMLHGACY